MKSYNGDFNDGSTHYTVDPALKAQSDAFNNWWKTQTQYDPNDMLAYQRQQGIQLYGKDPFADYSPHGGFFNNILDGIGKVADPIMEAAIKATPYILGADLGGIGLSALGGAGVGSAAAGAGAEGGLAGAGTGLATTGAEAGGLAAGAGGAASAGGLGALAGAAGADIPTVVITGSAAGGAGAGLGALSTLGAGLGGVGLLSSLGSDTIPVDSSLKDVPNVTGSEQVGVQGSDDIPSVIVPGGSGAGSALPTGGTGIGTVNPVVTPLPLPGGVTDVPKIDGGGGGNPGGNDGGVPSWLKDIPGLLGGLGNLLGAGVDYQHNQADMDYWQNLMNKAMGMYMPGTDEANMLEHKLEAKDAAAGRNSQYGIREQNLAALLAQQRSNIMMSPTFYRMGEAARGHYDNSLNSLFGAMGNLAGGGNSGSALKDLFGIGSSLWNNLGLGGGSSGGADVIPNVLF